MKHRVAIVLVLISLLCIQSCKKKEKKLPLVTTLNVSAIQGIQASCGGVVYFNGDAEVTERGVCWNSSGSPEISDTKTVDGSGEGNFTSILTPLYTGTKYYVRAYATSAAGTSYGAEMTFTTRQSNNIFLADIDGNIYETVKIGTQVWMAENLKVTHYRDGTPINYVEDDYSWSSSTVGGAYCLVDGNSSYVSVMGYLYNWKAAASPSGIAPPGWHVPTSNDWSQLINTLGGSNIAGGKMKSTNNNFWYDNVGASNSSGFNALPAGNRDYNSSYYYDLNYRANFWCSSASGGGFYYTFLQNNNTSAIQSLFNWQNGCSVRLVKD